MMSANSLRPASVIVFPAFCLATAVVASAMLTHVLGIVGFRAMPFVRLAVVAAAIVFIGVFLLQTRMKPRLAPGNLWKAVLALQLLGLVYLVLGLLRENSKFYLVTDLIYLLMFLMTFLLGAWCYRVGTLAFAYDKMIRAVLTLTAITSFCWAFNLQVGTPPELLILWGCALIISMAYKKHIHTLLLLLAVVPQIAGLNRALVLAVVGGLTIFFFSASLVKKIKVFAVVAVLLGVIVVVVNGLGVIKGSSFERRIDETLSLLSSSQDAGLPIPLQQRFYEGDLVNHDLQKTLLPVSLLFGLGYGYTLDMTQSIDSSVIDSQLMGGQQTHNIHFLSYALLARFGLLGALCFVFIFLSCARRCFVLFRKEATDATTVELLANLFVVLLFLFSAPASSFLFSSMLLGYFCGIANEARLTGISNRLLC
jgi:hypothetical protein